MSGIEAKTLRARLEPLALQFTLREVDDPPYGSLAFVNGTTALVFWLPGEGLRVALARVEALERPDPAFLPLWAVRQVLDPDPEGRDDGVYSVDEALESLATDAGHLLQGDFCIESQVLCLADEAEARSEARLRSQGRADALARADAAFEGRRYAQAVAGYERLRACLPPGRRRRLEWAQRRADRQ